MPVLTLNIETDTRLLIVADFFVGPKPNDLSVSIEAWNADYFGNISNAASYKLNLNGYCMSRTVAEMVIGLTHMIDNGLNAEQYDRALEMIREGLAALMGHAEKDEAARQLMGCIVSSFTFQHHNTAIR